MTDEEYFKNIAELNLRGLIEIAEEDGSSISLTDKGIMRAIELFHSIEMPDRLLVVLLVKYGMDDLNAKHPDKGYLEE